jgi:hypothetical protein
MRILEVGHGGYPAEGLVGMATDGYVGIEPKELRGRVHGLRERFSGYGNPWQLVRSGLKEYAKDFDDEPFDVVYMANVLGAPKNLVENSKRRAIENWSNILGAAASLLSSSPGANIWVVEHRTPPKRERILEAASLSGLTEGELVNGRSFNREVKAGAVYAPGFYRSKEPGEHTILRAIGCTLFPSLDRPYSLKLKRHSTG